MRGILRLSESKVNRGFAYCVRHQRRLLITQVACFMFLDKVATAMLRLARSTAQSQLPPGFVILSEALFFKTALTPTNYFVSPLSIHCVKRSNACGLSTKAEQVHQSTHLPSRHAASVLPTLLESWVNPNFDDTLVQCRPVKAGDGHQRVGVLRVPSKQQKTRVF